MTFIIIIALSSFLISLLGTRLVILALRKRPMLIDIPNLRSNHRAPTPKGGGIAVVFALVICLLIADINYLLILSILMLAAVSLLDDLIGLPILVRLLVQGLAVAAGLASFHGAIFSPLLPIWGDRLLAGLLWLWFINLFNFMDGIDGISATEMIAIGIGIALPAAFKGAFPHPLAIYGLITAAAGCGFIWWNWHPARIFLGDVGSIPIGFVLGYLLLVAFYFGYGSVAVILPAYYLSDGTITLAMRTWRGEKIWVAHSEHYYQKAVRAGHSHDTVVRCIFGLNILLIFLATKSVFEPGLIAFYISLAYFATFMLMGFFRYEKKIHAP